MGVPAAFKSNIYKNENTSFSEVVQILQNVCISSTNIENTKFLFINSISLEDMFIFVHSY